MAMASAEIVVVYAIEIVVVYAIEIVVVDVCCLCVCVDVCDT